MKNSPKIIWSAGRDSYLFLLKIFLDHTLNYEEKVHLLKKLIAENFFVTGILKKTPHFKVFKLIPIRFWGL